MARAQKLKVFRTPIGFHDAYVAAPSQKAALAAWGADSNLFAFGSAERVEDPELMREPLARPGEVIRRLRGTLAQHMAALPKDSPRRAPAKAKPSKPVEKPAPAAGKSKPPPPPKAKPPTKAKPPPKPRPRPDRTPLDLAETVLVAAEKRRAEAKALLMRRQAELDRERRTLEAQQARESEKLQKRLDTARDKYERAMRAWRAG